MNLPDNLPPLPPVPPGFDRWEYRGTAWETDHPIDKFAACFADGRKINRWWIYADDEATGAGYAHYIEAVRDEPAETLLDQGLQDNRPPA